MSVKITFITENKDKDNKNSRVLSYSETVPLLLPCVTWALLFMPHAVARAHVRNVACARGVILRL